MRHERMRGSCLGDRYGSGRNRWLFTGGGPRRRVEGAILFAMIAGFGCVIYAPDNRGS